MPTYSYVCETCGLEFDKYLSFKDNPDHQVCPNGHRQVRRIFTAPAIVFKGSGFYVTDHRSSNRSSIGGHSRSTESDSKTGAEGVASDSKTDNSAAKDKTSDKN